MNLIPEKCWVCQSELLLTNTIVHCHLKFKELDSVSYETSHFLIQKLSNETYKYYMFIKPYWVEWFEDQLVIDDRSGMNEHVLNIVCQISDFSFEKYRTLNVIENIQNILVLS